MLVLENEMFRKVVDTLFGAIPRLGHIHEVHEFKRG
jgi:flagellar motor switch protein FliM